MTIETSKTEFRWRDSHSDGMCGYVEIQHSQTGNVEKVRWSVSGPIDSQDAAVAEAKRRLLEAAR